MSKIDDKIKEAIAKELQKYPTANRTELANRFNVSRGTVYFVAKKINQILAPGVVDSEAKMQAQKQAADKYKTLYRAALKQTSEIRKELSVFREFNEVKDLIVPMNQPLVPYKGEKQAVPILVISDWHIDEPVDPATISGLNEFDVDIARDRVAWLAKFSAKIIRMLKCESDIDHLVIAALGDFMSGWIHEELQTSNPMTPVEAILEVLNMITGLLQNLLDAGLVKNITMVCCVGNHARITKKTFFKLRTKTSYEWMMYNLVMQHFTAKGEKRIKFQIPTGYFNWLNICGRDIRCHHGDNMKYNGGVSGIIVPAMKAIAQWNKGIHADLDIFGHWHTSAWEKDYVINGSLIGYNTYAEWLKCNFEKASQTLFLIHSRFGKTAHYPIVLQD